VALNQIEKDSHLLAFAAKWLGESEIIYSDQSHVRNIENDKKLCLRIWKLFNEADIVVAQNGDAFDIPIIRARMIKAGIKPPSQFRTVDTLKVARKTFRFTSAKLEYLSRFLGCRVKKSLHKRFPGFSLWTAVLKGNRLAWAEMRRYNLDDIRSLEEVYNKLLPWIEGHPNVGMYRVTNNPQCPKCGGKTQSRGIYLTNFGKYQRYQCTKCGGWSRGRKQLADPAHRKLQLQN
jgi:DNA polymerase elongation subunit (family B)